MSKRGSEDEDSPTKEKKFKSVTGDSKVADAAGRNLMSRQSPTSEDEMDVFTENVGKSLSLSGGLPFDVNADDVPQDKPSGSGSKSPNKSPKKRDRGEVYEFLRSIQLSHLYSIFDKEKITMEILLKMSASDLKEIGIPEFGYRSRLLTAIEELNGRVKVGGTNSVSLNSLDPEDDKFQLVETLMQGSIHRHKGDAGGEFDRYQIIKVESVNNEKLRQRFDVVKQWLVEDNDGNANQRLLFHGGDADSIIKEGFDVRKSSTKAYFGNGVYFAESSSKANQYSYGYIGAPCPVHDDVDCYKCERRLLLCTVLLGKTKCKKDSEQLGNSPDGFHSVTGTPSPGGLKYYEFVVYRSEQAYPSFLITYRLLRPDIEEGTN